MCILNIKGKNQTCHYYISRDRNGRVDSLIAEVSVALAFTIAACHHFSLPGMSAAVKGEYRSALTWCDYGSANQSRIFF